MTPETPRADAQSLLHGQGGCTRTGACKGNPTRGVTPGAKGPALCSGGADLSASALLLRPGTYPAPCSSARGHRIAANSCRMQRCQSAARDRGPAPAALPQQQGAGGACTGCCGAPGRHVRVGVARVSPAAAAAAGLLAGAAGRRPSHNHSTAHSPARPGAAAGAPRPAAGPTAPTTPCRQRTARQRQPSRGGSHSAEAPRAGPGQLSSAGQRWAARTRSPAARPGPWRAWSRGRSRRNCSRGAARTARSRPGTGWGRPARPGRSSSARAGPRGSRPARAGPTQPGPGKSRQLRGQRRRGRGRTTSTRPDDFGSLAVM